MLDATVVKCSFLLFAGGGNFRVIHHGIKLVGLAPSSPSPKYPKNWNQECWKNVNWKKTVQCEWRHKKSIGLISWKVKIKTVLLSLCEEKEKKTNCANLTPVIKNCYQRKKTQFFLSLCFDGRILDEKEKLCSCNVQILKKIKLYQHLRIGSILVKWTRSLNGLSVLVFFVRLSCGIQSKPERVAVKGYSKTCFLFAIAESEQFNFHLIICITSS